VSQAGSKAELVMAIAMLSTQPPGSLLTCNGYKDTEYMELVRYNSLLTTKCSLVEEPGITFARAMRAPHQGYVAIAARTLQQIKISFLEKTLDKYRT